MLGTLVLCVLISGCGSTDAEPATPAELDALKAAAAADPVLVAGDAINVIVYGESSLTGKYLIDPSGYVSLPLAGTVKACGLTPEQLGHELEKQFGSVLACEPTGVIARGPDRLVVRAIPPLHYRFQTACDGSKNPTKLNIA